MATAKEQAEEVIEKLPDTADWSAIIRSMQLNAAIAEAEADIAAGRVVPHSQILEDLAQWQTSSGPRELAGTSTR